MVYFALGCIVGGIISGLVSLLIIPKRSGNLIIDNTDSDGPYMFLELVDKPEKLQKQTMVVLAVKNRGYFDS